MRTKLAIERQLQHLERLMAEQLSAIRQSEKGFGGPESFMWDRRVIERNTLRWVLRRKEKAFSAADMMAGW